MSRYANRILVILMFVFFPGLVSAQPQVQETRLVTKHKRSLHLHASGGLGSELFAYSRYDEKRNGDKVFYLQGGKEVLAFEPSSPWFDQYISQVQVSRDDSRIVFVTDGGTSHYPIVVYAVRPDGSQLTQLVSSGDDCKGRFKHPGYGEPFCSLPYNPRLSPDGQWVLFVNTVREWDEEAQYNLDHYYLSMISVTGGPIVRLEEMGPGFGLAWSEDGTSIYYKYYSSGSDPWDGVPRRYDLQSGRSGFLTDTTWKAWSPGLAVSRADGTLYFVAKQGFVRLDPETREVEVVSEEQFETFDLSPDGLRAVGIKDGDVTIVDLEFPSSSPLVIEPGVGDELELGRIPAARRKWALQRGYASRQLYSEARKRNGVKRIRWLDNERLWCVVQEDRSTPTTASKPEVRVGIVRLAN